MTSSFGTKLLSSFDTNSEFNNLYLFKSQSSVSSYNLPLTFDGRVVWSNYFQPVDDQGSCVACWAFAALFTLSTRIAIYTQGRHQLNFSISSIVFTNNLKWNDVKQKLSEGIQVDRVDSTQEPAINGCRSQSLLNTWQHIYRYGVTHETCVNDKNRLQNIYTAEQVLGANFDQCLDNDNEHALFYRVDGYYYVPGTLSKVSTVFSGNEETIRREIYQFGPCSTAMKIFDDFLAWDGSGIYKWDQKSGLSSQNGHAVVLVGWGTDSITGVDYWIVRNSWGLNWGSDGGYFKIIRGINMCEIEENVLVGFPQFTSLRNYITHPILFTIDDFNLRGIWDVHDNGMKITSIESGSDPTKSNLLFPLEDCPDFSVLIAGEPNTIQYRYSGISQSKEGFELNTCSNSDFEYILSIALNIVIAILIIFLIAKIV